MVNKIEYIRGDLFAALPENPQRPIIIPHIVNNIGAWGSGFVIPLANRFPRSKEMYLKYYKLNSLGDIQTIIDDEYYIVNMFAQNGISDKSTGDGNRVKKPIKYVSLIKCMENIKNDMNRYFDIYCPRFGSDRAGGNWEFIEELIEEIWLPRNEIRNIKVFKYEK